MHESTFYDYDIYILMTVTWSEVWEKSIMYYVISFRFDMDSETPDHTLWNQQDQRLITLKGLW